MWNGPLHDPEFVGEMLDELKANSDDFATATRIEGMLTVAQSVRPYSPPSYAHLLTRN